MNHFEIDGQPVPFEDGETLMTAATRAGHAVPHLCWHPQLAPSGACRLCTVQVDGRMAAACTTQAAKGMVVKSHTPQIKGLRTQLTQMLFVEGNHYCPGCEKSGNCELQSAAYVLGMTDMHHDMLMPQHAVDASHPDMWLDHNRCILCKLCVRASHELDGKGVFAIGGHSGHTQLLVNSPDGLLGTSALQASDHAAHICPVGALLPKRRGFAVPIGQRHCDTAHPTTARNPTMAEPETRPALAPGRPLRVATVSLAGCFGCHMSLLDIDERLFTLAGHVQFDRSPLTDIKHCGPCDVGLIEGGLCNSENIAVLREFRAQCTLLVAVGACAINGGLPAMRNGLDVSVLLADVYGARPGLAAGSTIPSDPELPLPLARVHPLHEVVHIDHFLPGCPPSADVIWNFLNALVEGRTPQADPALIRYD